MSQRVFFIVLIETKQAHVVEVLYNKVLVTTDYYSYGPTAQKKDLQQM